MATLILSEIITNYLKYQENVNSCSPQTIRAYTLDLAQAFNNGSSPRKAKSLSETELLELSREALLGWGPLSLASRNRKTATLKSFFRWLFEHSITSADLGSRLVCPKVPKKIPHFISVDEVIAVLKTASREIEIEKEKSHGSEKVGLLEKQRALFSILYGGGLRISEACSLKWSQIHFEKRSLLIKGKGSKERIAILPAFVMDQLSSLKKTSNSFSSDFIFQEKTLNTRIGYEWIRQLGIKAGLMNPLHPHALRHSFATHMLASGANLRTLQSLLGHDSLQATEKYTHLSVDQLARTIEQTHPLHKTKRFLK